jgi:hypothetical protein
MLELASRPGCFASTKGASVAISSSGRRQEPIHVVPMALILLLAAFTGGALGLVWQSTGLGDEEEHVTADEARLVAEEERDDGQQ